MLIFITHMKIAAVNLPASTVVIIINAPIAAARTSHAAVDSNADSLVTPLFWSMGHAER